ncbi:hypothetical protein JCM10207_002365 [Rhodosporidiobolus poonsookiae]
MDTFLDPSGTLAFLDPAAQLHPAVGHTLGVSTQPLPPFDYDSWLDPAAAQSYDAQSMMALGQESGAASPALLDARTALHPAGGGSHFGVLGGDARASSRPGSGSVSPALTGNVATTVAPNGTLQLGYGGGDYASDFLHLTTSTPASGTAQRNPPVQQPYAPVTASALSAALGGSGAMSATDPSTFSIAAYGNDRSLRSSVTSSSASYSPRAPTRSSNVMKAPAAPSSSAVGVATRSRNGAKTPKTPQADESVPEAALHLLRLAGTAEGSAGSVATNSTGRDGDGSDEDAEGESDDTSIHSTDLLAKPLGGQLFSNLTGGVAQQGQLETRVWLHNPDQPPLHVQRGGGPGSQRPSAASSVTSTRIRQHVPARAQREASVASTLSRAPSETPSAAAFQPGNSRSQQSPAVGRRTSSRIRKTVVPTQIEADSDTSASEAEFKLEDADGDGDDSDSGKGKKKKGKGTASKATKGKGKGKRASTAGGSSTPAKKARTSSVSVGAAMPPRKARRQGYVPPVLANRSFPASVEIHPGFPLFYRTFPVSAAFPPDSYVLKAAPSSRRSSVQAMPQHAQLGHHSPTVGSLNTMLPTPPAMPVYEQYFAPYHQAMGTPLGSPSTATLPNFTLDAHGNFAIQDLAHLPSPHHSHPHAGLPPHSHGALAVHPALSGGLPLPHPHPHQHTHTPGTMSPPQLPTASSSGANTPIASSSSSVIGGATSAVGPPSVPGPNGIALLQPPPETKWNKPSDPLNLYWPRFVKGNADDKCGMCPICAEPPERGGKGVIEWLKLKNSSYVYHLSYAHGISNTTGKPFSPPVQTRVVKIDNKSKDNRSEMTEGLCHKCNGWIALLSVKNVDANVPELIWWKHAKKCHGETTIAGEGDCLAHDAVYDLVVQRKAEHGGDGVPTATAAMQAAAAMLR